MIVVRADRSDPINVASFDRFAVPLWVEFPIFAFTLIVVVSWAVLAVHTKSVISLALVVSLSFQTEISFADGMFTINDGDSNVTVPLSAAAPPMEISDEKLSMQIGETLITFDHRGLGIQYGDKGGFTKLGYMPTTPKLFTREQILRNVELIDSGKRTATVSALSGIEVIGDSVYLLLRWDDSERQPWLETLAYIDTSGDAPKVNLIGRFVGFSFAKGLISDELHGSDKRLFAVTKSEQGYGVGDYSSIDSQLDYRVVPGVVDRINLFGDKFLTERTTVYGTTMVGLLDPLSLEHSTILEIRGSVNHSRLSSAFKIVENEVASFVSLNTGAKLTVELGRAYVETKFGVLSWSPVDAPESAELMSPSGWKTVASWTIED